MVTVELEDYYLFQHPVIAVNKVKDLTQLSNPSAYKLIEELEKIGLLKEITGAQRGKLYMFRSYVDLFS